MAEFVYNRTLADVNRLKWLHSKGYENLTGSQKIELRSNNHLGAYNKSDLNRVESAVAIIAPALGLSLTTVTAWHSLSLATPSEMNRYLGNVVAVRNAALAIDDTLVLPELPVSMSKLTYEGANNIEKTLSIIYDRFCSTTQSMVLGETKLGEAVLG